MTGIEKRKEARVPFQADCSAEILAPLNFATSGMIEGQTVNITEHGLMIALPGIRREVVAGWQARLDEGNLILFQVILKDYPGVPPLRGEAVWTNWVPDSDTGACAQVGMLFEMVSYSDIEALRGILGLVSEPPTPTDN